MYLSLTNKYKNNLGLSCAKLRPAYTSYPLVFGLLAFADAVFYVQLCLLKFAAAKKNWVWVIKSTTTEKKNFLDRAGLHSSSASGELASS